MTLGIRLGWMDQCGIFRLCPFLPIVHWDGMDSGDTPISSEATELGRQFGVYSVHSVLTCVLGQ